MRRPAAGQRSRCPCFWMSCPGVPYRTLPGGRGAGRLAPSEALGESLERIPLPPIGRPARCGVSLHAPAIDPSRFKPNRRNRSVSSVRPCFISSSASRSPEASSPVSTRACSTCAAPSTSPRSSSSSASVQAAFLSPPSAKACSPSRSPRSASRSTSRWVNNNQNSCRVHYRRRRRRAVPVPPRPGRCALRAARPAAGRQPHRRRRCGRATPVSSLTGPVGGDLGVGNLVVKHHRERPGR